MARTLASVAKAFDQQAAEAVEWLRRCDPADFAQCSALDGWDVRTLVGHLVSVRTGFIDRLRTTGELPAIPLHEYVSRYRGAARQIEEATAAAAAQHTGSHLVERFASAPTAADAVAGIEPRKVIRAARGTITAIDWASSRLIELVVHCDDLSRSVPDREPIPLIPPALADVCRELARILAAQQPGHTVEVRVPPFAAVQAVEGPAHTRGTPPNVVETDPVTWLRLATGRLSYIEAVSAARVHASGSRSDLSAFLPLLS
jgi:uncharacterized protein (TIGR03083 family)